MSDGWAASNASPLDLPGVDALGEGVYLAVLMEGRVRVADIATRVQTDEATALTCLERLRSAGLVTRLESEDPEYSAVDPRFAVRSLAQQLTERGQRLRDSIPVLAEHFDAATASSADEPQSLFVTDPDAVAGWYARLQHQAKAEFLAFDRPPYVAASFDPFESAVLARGVLWRAIYTVSSFDEGATWEEVSALADQGEQSRITDDLPLKLVVVDSSVALVSLSLSPGQVTALVTSAPPLVAALRSLFEFEWERAVPLAVAAPLRGLPERTRRYPPSLAGQPSAEDLSILTFMAVGMKDDAIARQLGISSRTLRRRSQELMAVLGAGNRFQAGVEASRRGWI